MADSDEIPVLDAVEGWPLPEGQPEWYGGAASEEALFNALRGGRMHHAWLVTGARGVGKATLAYRFARFALANPDPAALGTRPPSLALDGEERVFRQVAARAHPNVLTLQKPWDDKTKRYRTELTVNEVRRIQSFFGSTAGEGAWRICIVDTADDLNISAANALLKMLEEPPQRSLFFLLASRPGKLLPTIRSRCRRLDLAPLTPDTISTALRDHGEDGSDDELRLASALANGSLRRAILLLRGEGVDIYRQFQAVVSDLPRIDYRAAHALADRVAARGDEDAYAGFLDSVEGWLSRRVRGEAEPGGAAVAPAAAAASLATWADVWEKAAELAFQSEDLNLDRKQVVLQIFMALARAARM